MTSRFLFAALPLALASTATAQWTVVQLGVGTQVLGAHGSQQVGVVGDRASVWTGSGASWIDLGTGIAEATDGTHQVGVTPGNHAALWTGSAGSLVDLHPDFYAASSATGVDGNLQCGSAAHSLSVYACVWSGTRESIVFLQAPSNTSIRTALDIHADQVVGYYRSNFTSTNHACLWVNLAVGIDLNPAGATASEAWAVHSGTQVGFASIGGQRAALWTGSAASHVDLHPAGASTSNARGVHGDVQVGVAVIGGSQHASLWRGTAASWVDLHAILPPAATSSSATDVWIDDNGVVYVAGNSSLGGVLWIDASNSIRTFCRGDGSGTACPCGNDAPSGTDSGCLNALGVGARLAASGTARISSDQLVLTGTQMPATSSVLYFQGTAQEGGGAGSVFGDGLRCAAGAVIRVGAKLNSGGMSSYPGVGDAPISVRGQVALPGVTRTYQAWYRNITSFCTPSPFNLTNGVSVSWIP